MESEPTVMIHAPLGCAGARLATRVCKNCGFVFRNVRVTVYGETEEHKCETVGRRQSKRLSLDMLPAMTMDAQGGVMGVIVNDNNTVEMFNVDKPSDVVYIIRKTKISNPVVHLKVARYAYDIEGRGLVTYPSSRLSELKAVLGPNVRLSSYDRGSDSDSMYARVQGGELVIE